MKRLWLDRMPYLLGLLLLALPASAWAQSDPSDLDEIPEPPAEPPPTDEDLAPDDIPPGADEAAADEAQQPKRSAEALRQARLDSWKDIVVVPRKSFLKRRRVELTPFIGTTINDTLIQHTAFGAEINYFLTDVLAIGVQGLLYVSNLTDDEFFVRYHFSRVPSINEYTYSVTGNFSYVPIYGKFAVLNRHIFHWDIWLSGGAGITRTKVIPRDLNNEAFANISLTFPVTVGGRLFVTRWMAVHLALRNYLMLDKFEQPGRSKRDANEAKEQQSDTRFINNMVLSLGVGFYLPWSFDYTTAR